MDPWIHGSMDPWIHGSAAGAAAGAAASAAALCIYYVRGASRHPVCTMYMMKYIQ